MRATRTFTDEKLKKNRKNGEEWLISIEDTETHIPNVYEEVCPYNHYNPQIIGIWNLGDPNAIYI